MSRAKQRENHRAKSYEIKLGLRPAAEEKLELRDYCGMKDPTPYEAVRNMIREERYVRRKTGKKIRDAAAM